MILLYVAFIVLKYDTSDTSFYHKGMLNIGEHVFFFFSGSIEMILEFLFIILLCAV